MYVQCIVHLHYIAVLLCKHLQFTDVFTIITTKGQSVGYDSCSTVPGVYDSKQTESEAATVSGVYGVSKQTSSLGNTL